MYILANCSVNSLNDDQYVNTLNIIILLNYAIILVNSAIFLLNSAIILLKDVNILQKDITF